MPTEATLAAWREYLDQRDVEVRAAVAVAVRTWLDDHAEQIVDAIVAATQRQATP